MPVSFRSFFRSFAPPRPTRMRLSVEPLESRLVPALLVPIGDPTDYGVLGSAGSRYFQAGPDGETIASDSQSYPADDSDVPFSFTTRFATSSLNREILGPGQVRLSSTSIITPGDSFVGGDANAIMNLGVLYRIDPEPGKDEQAGDLVRLTLSLSGAATGGNIYTSGFATLRGTSASGYPLVTSLLLTPGGSTSTTAAITGIGIGSTVQLGAYVATQTYSVGGFALNNSVNLETGVTVETLTDILPTSFSWDVVNGGVDFTYTNSRSLDGAATYALSWLVQNGEEYSIIDSGARGPLATGRGSQEPISVPAQAIGTPPEGAVELILNLDNTNAIDETFAGETNNFLTLPFEARIESFTATYDGTGPNDAIIGRFFTGVNVPDQAFTVRLPEELLALQPAVFVTIGSTTLAALRQAGGDGRTFVTAAFDPGTLTADTTARVEVRAPAGVGGVLLTREATIDVEPLPSWYSALGGVGEMPRQFVFEGGSYFVSGGLINYTSPSLSKLPGALGDWAVAAVDAAGLKTELTAIVAVLVEADLNPTVAPTVTGFLTASATVLGDPAFAPVQVASDDAGPFQLTLNLDPRTLELAGAVVRYHPDGNVLPAGRSIPLLRGTQFSSTLLGVTSNLTLTPTMTVDLRLEVGYTKESGLSVKGGYADVEVRGQIGGTLAELKWFPQSAVVQTLTRLGQYGRVAFGPAAVATQVLSYLAGELAKNVFDSVFTFTLTANGQITLGGRVSYDSGGGFATQFRGSALLAARAQAAINLPFFSTTFLAPDWFNNLFLIGRRPADGVSPPAPITWQLP